MSKADAHDGRASEGGRKKKRAKRLFSKEEDDLIRFLVMKHGEKSWRFVSSQLHGRTPRQCRERWKNYLCPTVRNAPWCAEEDNRLLQLVQDMGPQWARIAAMLGSRTDVNVKNRWVLLKRKEAKAGRVRQAGDAGAKAGDAEQKDSELIEFWDEQWDMEDGKSDH